MDLVSFTLAEHLADGLRGGPRCNARDRRPGSQDPYLALERATENAVRLLARVAVAIALVSVIAVGTMTLVGPDGGVETAQAVPSP